MTPVRVAIRNSRLITVLSMVMDRLGPFVGIKPLQLAAANATKSKKRKPVPAFLLALLKNVLFLPNVTVWKANVNTTFSKRQTVIVFNIACRLMTRWCTKR